jgi:hypothetical protein
MLPLSRDDVDADCARQQHHHPVASLDGLLGRLLLRFLGGARFLGQIRRVRLVLIPEIGGDGGPRVRRPLPRARRLPIEFQLTIPFTDRSVVMTGSCEKSFASIKVIASCRLASGEIRVGELFAAASLLMR